MDPRVSLDAVAPDGKMRILVFWVTMPCSFAVHLEVLCPAHGGDILYRNIGNHVQDYMLS